MQGFREERSEFLELLSDFARTQKQLLSISAAAALPRHPKADRAASGVLYTYIDTHARSGVGIAVHTRLQTPFRAFKLPIPNATYGCVVGRQLELQVDSERLAVVSPGRPELRPGLYTTTG